MFKQDEEPELFVLFAFKWDNGRMEGEALKVPNYCCEAGHKIENERSGQIAEYGHVITENYNGIDSLQDNLPQNA